MHENVGEIGGGRQPGDGGRSDRRSCRRRRRQPRRFARPPSEWRRCADRRQGEKFIQEFVYTYAVSAVLYTVYTMCSYFGKGKGKKLHEADLHVSFHLICGNLTQTFIQEKYLIFISNY